VLVFTDGIDNASWLSASQLLAAVRRLGIVVHVVELTAAYRRTSFLDELASAAMMHLDLVLSERETTDDRIALHLSLALDITNRLGDINGAPRFRREAIGSIQEHLYELWSATSSRDLKGAFTRAIDEMRGRYLVTFYPQGVQREGWHELKVTVKARGEVKARPGYYVEKS
jgi:hypothetical protein